MELSERHIIKFTFLPPNSTHLLQPLDVAMFASMNKTWRKVLTDWKTSPMGIRYATLPKNRFPASLSELMNTLESISEYAKAGFGACGIYQFNPDCPLAKVRTDLPDLDRSREHVSTAVLEYLEEARQTAHQPMRVRA